MHIRLIVTTLVQAIFISICMGGEMEETKIHYKALPEVKSTIWQSLSDKKIYFGHQSVGFNIVEGLKDEIKENQNVRLSMIETKDPKDFGKGVFAHSRVGKNEDPQSKIKAFSQFMKDGIGEQADIAFFKFCFVDIDGNTDVPKLFESYVEEMSLLKQQFPKLKIIHFTVPLLKQDESSFKKKLLKLIGKSTGFFDESHNIARNNFNKLLLERYQGKEPVFDIARVESTYSDGKREIFEKGGKEYFALIPAYTHDGGHLNEVGRRLVAQQLLLCLLNTI